LRAGRLRAEHRLRAAGLALIAESGTLPAELRRKINAAPLQAGDRAGARVRRVRDRLPVPVSMPARAPARFMPKPAVAWSRASCWPGALAKGESRLTKLP
jgi:hypothetical protein